MKEGQNGILNTLENETKQLKENRNFIVQEIRQVTQIVIKEVTSPIMEVLKSNENKCELVIENVKNERIKLLKTKP
jgi:phenylpyruvate tautomerase PptA (4-oxalocrotonate tautomerase family)